MVLLRAMLSGVGREGKKGERAESSNVWNRLRRLRAAGAVMRAVSRQGRTAAAAAIRVCSAVCRQGKKERKPRKMRSSGTAHAHTDLPPSFPPRRLRATETSERATSRVSVAGPAGMSDVSTRPPKSQHLRGRAMTAGRMAQQSTIAVPVRLPSYSHIADKVRYCI